MDMKAGVQVSKPTTFTDSDLRTIECVAYSVTATAINREREEGVYE